MTGWVDRPVRDLHLRSLSAPASVIVQFRLDVLVVRQNPLAPFVPLGSPHGTPLRLFLLLVNGFTWINDQPVGILQWY